MGEGRGRRGGERRGAEWKRGETRGVVARKTYWRMGRGDGGREEGKGGWAGRIKPALNPPRKFECAKILQQLASVDIN